MNRRATFPCLALWILVGCSAYQTQKQLEGVAKDWSMTIRASQVIPVYPLTEDLEPGDLFLVLTPVPRQAEVYAERGFLPLDQHMARLTGLDFAGFYKDAYDTEGKDSTPHHWREEDKWAEAPRAAFPTYNFTVKSGGGIQAALPIQGVPVGLGLMKTDSASGTVTIADTYTYGVGFDQLAPLVRTWAQRPDIHDTLRRLRVAVGHSIYLRVVSRVYLTGSVVVSLTNTESASGRLDAGAAKDLGIAELATGENAANFEKALALIGKSINEALPGGSIGLAWASDRAVALAEEFPRPLVIGYLGFDFPILANGTLGVPVATREQLETGGQPVEVALGSGPSISALRLILADLQQRAERGDEQAKSYVERLASFGGRVPERYPVAVFVLDLTDDNRQHLQKKAEKGAPVALSQAGLDRFLTFYATLQSSVENIDVALGNPEVVVDPAVRETLRDERTATRDEVERLASLLGSDPTVAAAVAYWWSGYQD